MSLPPKVAQIYDFLPVAPAGALGERGGAEAERRPVSPLTRPRSHAR